MTRYWRKEPYGPDKRLPIVMPYLAEGYEYPVTPFGKFIFFFF